LTTAHISLPSQHARTLSRISRRLVSLSGLGSAGERAVRIKARTGALRPRSVPAHQRGSCSPTTSDRERIQAGRQLLQRVIDEHPDDAQQVSSAHYSLGDTFARERRDTEAQEHLRACLALEATVSVFHNTELRLAEVLIHDNGASSLDEAWELLDVAADQKGVLFHNIAWRIEIVRARLRAHQGDQAAAAAHARNALQLLDHNEPQFNRHPDVGLIIPDRANRPRAQAPSTTLSAPNAARAGESLDRI